jgi:Tol biopolymer transport system component
VALALDIAEPRGAEDAPDAVAAATARPRPLVKIAMVAVAAAGALLAGYALLRGRSDPATARLTNPVQVTTDIGVEEYADWSPDGRTLAYAANPSGNPNPSGQNWDIWVAQPGGGRPVNLTPDSRARDLFPSWSPHGTQVAFWSDRDGGGCYVMPALGGAARKVLDTGPLDPNPPQWSPDEATLTCVVSPSPRTVEMHVAALATGELLRTERLPGEQRRSFVRLNRDHTVGAVVASSAGLASDVSQLWTFETNGRSARPITDGMSRVVSPSWSADGRLLYYVAPSGANMDLWQQRVDRAGVPVGPPVAVTAGLGLRNAALSNDGRKLAYSQGRRIANIWRVPILGDRAATWAVAEQITFDQAYIECTDVSRDGTRLAFSSDRAGSFDLWSLPTAGGGEMQRLTTDPSAEWCPRWSPNGSRLVFYAYRSGNRDIWTMPSQGGAWTQVTTNPGTDMHPSWSPDGEEVVYLGVGPGGVGVFVSPASGGAPRLISDSPNPASQWSPVDRQIAFSSQGKLWIADADDGGPARLLLDRSSNRPIWDPAGTRLFFSTPGPDQRVYSIAEDGTGERVVASFTGRRGVLGPNSLSTDGHYLYFTWEEDLGDIWTMDVQITR